MVDKVKTASDFIGECKELEDNWSRRKTRFMDWYKILRMEDQLAQANMESFVSNDPRTFYNLSLYLLCTDIPHRIPTDNLEQEEISMASDLEKVVALAWKDQESKYRTRGKQGWLWNLAGLTFLTGWRCIFAMIDNDVCTAEVWHPAQVYPEFSDDGMVRVARIYPLTKHQATVKIARNKWKYDKTITSDLKLYNYWFYDESGRPVNVIVLGDVIVKNMTESTDIIPVFITPVGGLPDDGSITEDDSWVETIGQSALATNEIVYRNDNKQRTFSQQLMRDTATPRWFEKSASGKILDSANIFKRGAIFRGGFNDDVRALEVPPMPIELRIALMDIDNMKQRGSLPWALHGNLQQEISGYLMSQISASAQQVLKPFHDAISSGMADVDNFWLKMMIDKGFRPYGIKLNVKKDTASKFYMLADYTLKVPGDVVQRATVARMINPDFRVSTTTAMDLLFPEISNPIKEQALARRDVAMKHPISITIDQIVAYKKVAAELREAKDTESAEMYEKAAKMLESQIGIQEGSATEPGQSNKLPRPEAAPVQSYTAQGPEGSVMNSLL